MAKTNQVTPRPPGRRLAQQTQEQLLDDIARLVHNVTDRHERNLLRGAIQEIKDRRAGKT